MDVHCLKWSDVLIFEANLPKFLWAYAVMCAAYTRNRCYDSRIGKTALEAFSGRRPNVSHMHAFWEGVLCISTKQEETRMIDVSKVS